MFFVTVWIFLFQFLGRGGILGIIYVIYFWVGGCYDLTEFTNAIQFFLDSVNITNKTMRAMQNSVIEFMPIIMHFKWFP